MRIKLKDMSGDFFDKLKEQKIASFRFVRWHSKDLLNKSVTITFEIDGEESCVDRGFTIPTDNIYFEIVETKKYVPCEPRKERKTSWFKRFIGWKEYEGE